MNAKELKNVVDLARQFTVAYPRMVESSDLKDIRMVENYMRNMEVVNEMQESSLISA